MTRWVAIPDRVVEKAWAGVDAEMKRFREAANTQVLSGTHEQGIFRGLVAEWATAHYIGGRWISPGREGRKSGVDVVSARGARIDVKATSMWKPLMIPTTQLYKIDFKRIDLFVLAFYEPPRPVVELCGWTSVTRFLHEHTIARSLPQPAAVMPASALRWLPKRDELVSPPPCPTPSTKSCAFWRGRSTTTQPAR